MLKQYKIVFLVIILENLIIKSFKVLEIFATISSYSDTQKFKSKLVKYKCLYKSKRHY
jgi:hypothetical protein